MKYQKISITKGCWYARALFMKPKFKKMGRDCIIGRPTIITGTRYIELGDDVHIYPNVRLECIPLKKSKIVPKIVIGNNVAIAQNVEIYASEKVIIQRNVDIGPNVMIGDSSHGYYKNDVSVLDQPLTVKPIVIEENTWIGAGAVILPGVHIGKHCVIGANCVIDRDIADNSVTKPANNKIAVMPEEWFK